MKVVISGMGVYSALGVSLHEFWEGIEQGRSGIGPVTRFDVSPFESKQGGMISLGDLIDSDEKRLMAYALTAAEEALFNAGITDNSKVSLVLGTSNGIMRRKIYEISDYLAGELKLGGLVITVSTACTSSAHAIGFAADLLRKGNASQVLAGGVDILTRKVFAGFYNLGLLARSACSPFSSSPGTTLGEGAAFLLMESENSAANRGIEPQSVFMGYGIAADGFHDTKPDQSGAGICKAIVSSLQDSSLEPEDIDYINAHGTGTAANDSAEWRGIQKALADRSSRIPVSSSKSYFGHAQGAASAMEAVATILSMQHLVVPPTLNYTRPRPFSPADPVADVRPRPQDTRFALKTSSGFAGVNSALIFGRKDVPVHSREICCRSVSIAGFGINTDRDYISRFVPEDELRSTDLSANLLAGAVAMILNDAGFSFRSKECENIGLFVGQDRLSGESVDALDDSIRERGIKHLSASAFTRLVINYPAGVSCRMFGIKGPVAAVAAKPDNGMTALCLGADFLSRRKDTDLMIIASVDEPEGTDGVACAAAILLKAGDEGSPFRLKGWSMNRDFNQATEEALKMACRSERDPALEAVAAEPGVPGLWMLIKTMEKFRKSGQQSLLFKNEGDLNHMGINIIIEKNGTTTT